MMGRRLVFLATTAGATIVTRETAAIMTEAAMTEAGTTAAMMAAMAAGLLTEVGVGVAEPMPGAAAAVDPMAVVVEAVVVDMAVDLSSIIKIIL